MFIIFLLQDEGGNEDDEEEEVEVEVRRNHDLDVFIPSF